MKEQKIAPVLSEPDISEIFATTSDCFPVFARAIEQAVLDRAGADAVRDAALDDVLRVLQGWEHPENPQANDIADAIRALKVTPAAALADAQPVAWPEADAENAAIGWTLDFKFVEQVREVAAMGYGFSAGQEEAEAILMAALSVHPLYEAPQAGQLSENAGEVDASAWQGWATQKPDRLPKLWGARHIAELNWDEDGEADLIRLVEVERIAASKGANHG